MNIHNDVYMDLLFRGVKRQHEYMDMSGKVESGPVFKFTSSLLKIFLYKAHGDRVSNQTATA